MPKLHFIVRPKCFETTFLGPAIFAPLYNEFKSEQNLWLSLFRFKFAALKITRTNITLLWYAKTLCKRYEDYSSLWLLEMCVTHLYFTAAIIILGAGMMLATLVFIAEHVFSLVLGYRGYSRTDL